MLFSLTAGTLVLLLSELFVEGQDELFSIQHALALKEISNPRISPEGKWVAFEVGTADLEDDRALKDIFMVRSSGGPAVQLTQDEASDSFPRWSPDGRYLAFLSSRKNQKNQIWLLDRRGGEARAISSIKNGISKFGWSPDGKRIVFVARDEDPDQVEKDEKDNTPPPIVIRRLQFKRDRKGYLKELYQHLYLLDIATLAVEQLTSGPYDDSDPAWSPDGSRIVFVSNRTAEPDSNDNSDLFWVEPDSKSIEQITQNPGPDTSPSWRKDSQALTYVTSQKPELIWYATRHLAIFELKSAEPRLLTRELDRNISAPAFTDSGQIQFLLEDSGNQHLCSIDPDSGRLVRIVAGERHVQQLHVGASTAIVVSEPHSPGEVFVWSPGSDGAKKITTTNDPLLSRSRLAEVENIQFKSGDGTLAEGFVTKPASFTRGRRYPTVLWIHGGPVSHFSNKFQEVWQVLAGAGFVVVAANPRGSSGYGEDFSRAIWADWGNLDYQDVMAAVDHTIALGYTDPERLAVGGWSYGGILTNYVITQTTRFKAAVSGASETNYWSCYGTDHYQHQWETELGLPWENLDLYVRLSPLTRVASIVTPTLILCGEKDWNVPLSQSEQLYQSLRRLGRETELIIYPGESHSIKKPSYRKDRYERYLAWFNLHLNGVPRK